MQRCGERERERGRERERERAPSVLLTTRITGLDIVYSPDAPRSSPRLSDEAAAAGWCGL